MSIKNLKPKKCGSRASQLARFLHREGKKYCAVALCASLIAGNLGSSAVAADESDTREFELDRAVLYEALQEAVMADEIVDETFTFAGEAADTYDSLLNMVDDGNLYELKPEIEDNDGSLQLRVFARLDGDIELESAYEVDGSEEMIFLLTNTSKTERTAVIRVDDKTTEEIKVAPGKAVLSNADLEAYKSAAEQAGPGMEGETAATGEGAVVSGSPASGGSGGGSGSGGGGSHSGGSNSGSSIGDETNGFDGTDAADSTQDDAPAADDRQENGVGQESGGVQDTENGDSTTEKGTDAGNKENQNPAEGNDNAAGDAAGGSDQNQSDVKDSDVSIDDSGKDGAEDKDHGSSDQGQASGGNQEEAGSDQSGNSGNNGNSGDEDHSDHDSDNRSDSNTGNDSGSSADDHDQGDSGEAGGADDKSDSSLAAVSYHETYRVAATPSDAEKEEADTASPSDASDSNANKNLLDGTVYETVLMDETAVTAFVTTFADLGLDDFDLGELATNSDAIRVYRMELEDVSVEVRALKGTFPENVEMTVTKLSGEDEQYETTKEALSNSGVQYDGLLAYDVTFYDEDGNEIEPDGDVSVALELKKQALDDYVNLDSLTVQHLKETEDGIQVEAVADVSSDTAGTVEVNEEALVTAAFSLDSFSVLAVPYSVDSYIVSSVSIKDDIFNSGSLVAEVTGEGNLDSVDYRWYISDDGSNWTLIEDTATVDSKKAEYYVARDGAQKYFKVAVTGTDGVTKESGGFKVDYYDSLQNGSFETPVVKDGDYSTYATTGHFLQIPNGTAGLEWKTSAYGNKWGTSSYGYYIEIADGSRKNYGTDRRPSYNNPETVYNISGAADGDQFAELNCQVAGALYQDVLTQPGSTLYWGLEHAGRQGEDTMAVIISNTKDLPNGWNPGSDYDARPNDIQAIITDPSGSWAYHTGTYVVPEGQYVTRFYFVAVSAAGGIADGNLLDNISFSKDVPNPPAAKGNLIITKEVDGIDQVTVPAGTFEFEVKQGETVVRTVSLPTASGAWSVVADNLDPDTYTVVEKEIGDLIGCEYKGTTYSVGSANATEGRETALTIESKKNTTVTFTNAYEKLVDIEIRKQVTGNLGDRNKLFTFTAILKKENTAIAFPEQNNSVHLSDDKMTATFDLSDGSAVTLTGLPEGAVLTVSEDRADYDVEVKQGEATLNDDKTDGSVDITLKDSNETVVFTNTKDGNVDAGVLLDTLPYILILAAVAAGVAFFVIRKRRSDEDDLD